MGPGSRKRARARGGGGVYIGWRADGCAREGDVWAEVVWVHAIVCLRGSVTRAARRWARFYEGPGVKGGRGGGAYDEPL